MSKTSIQNIGPPVKVYNTRLRKKIENEERAHFEAHYQKNLDTVTSNMARMTSLLEQLLWEQLKEGTSSQQPTLPKPLATPIIMDP